MIGQYSHNIDAKGRLFIPAKLREELGETWYLTKGRDGCLQLFSTDSWQRFMDELAQQPFSKVKELRHLLANAAECKPDTQGRILIPNKLRESARLEKEVVINGCFDRLELWNEERWNEMEEEAMASGNWEKALDEMGL